MVEVETSGQSSGVKSIMDISSPYFLTSADHPGLNFVGENLLRDGNYGDWQSEMTNALFAKNKFGFVDGTIPMPKEDSADLMNWKRCNAMVRGWLVSSMEKEIKNSVKYAVTAQDMWLDLKERFGKENAPRAYELRRTITTINQGNMTVSAYYTKLRGVWDEIQSITPIPTCTCTGCKCEISKEITKMRDKERLYDFLMGLNEEYGAVKTQILSTINFPHLVQHTTSLVKMNNRGWLELLAMLPPKLQHSRRQEEVFRDNKTGNQGLHQQTGRMIATRIRKRIDGVPTARNLGTPSMDVLS